MATREFQDRLARRLRELRGDKTIRAFAKEIGISPATLYRVENGTQRVSIEILEELCSQLGCTPNDLLLEE